MSMESLGIKDRLSGKVIHGSKLGKAAYLTSEEERDMKK